MESFFLFIVIFCTLFFIVIYTFDYFIRTPGYKGPVSDHFDGREFYSIGKGYKIRENIPGEGHNESFLKWIIFRPRNTWHHKKNSHTPILEKRVGGKRIIVTYINHSTVFIQTESLNILTDPVWAHRVSPFPLMGPVRYRPPGVKLSDLPPVDVVLLSHNHYDHMDLHTLKKLYKRDNPRIYAPLGNSRYLKSKGIFGVIDMDWWDKHELSSEIKLVSVPSQHFSSRSLSDRNRTLWCGFVLETSRGPVYISGDTGYGKFVEKIKEKYPKFILGFIPIGAFRPEWIMSPVHISPDEAIHLHKELNIETSIAIHFGTFKLASDGQEEAPNRIKELVKEALPAHVDFRVLENGQTIMI